jgi:hypothetical protein
METPVAEQQQLRAALDAALAATTDFGIDKLKDPRLLKDVCSRGSRRAS